MNKSCLKVITLIALVILIFIPGCKTVETVEIVIIKYNLSIDVAEGVDGNPATGDYQKEENEVVSYSYALKAGFQNLVVTLDGVAITANGSFTVTSNHKLEVTADEIFDIRGQWKLTLDWNIGSPDSWNMTLSGGLTSGNYNDQYGEHGTYTVDGSSVEINCPWFPMKLVGTISSQTEMSGDINGTIAGGTWSATKK